MPAHGPSDQWRSHGSILGFGVSVWFVGEVVKLHLDHTPRWPPEIRPVTVQKSHHLRGATLGLCSGAGHMGHISMDIMRLPGSRLGGHEQIGCSVGLAPRAA